ncbi:Alpha/Beta hydrolase protein [Syncephalastrum racemosum]|uniref:Alpha/Beta hydrolase protein n=1 Tax=Syncephalastrum racemosum TaxID=13706 RepID=A0A1X2HRU7_SYNRA|nr:Alpha/Beta hydrolase protein [Syncephalastrum racemosum]
MNRERAATQNGISYSIVRTRGHRRCRSRSTMWSSFRAWLVLFLLRFAFTWGQYEYLQKIVNILGYLVPTEKNWTLPDEKGVWIAEDITKAKKEDLADRIAASDIVILWVPGGGFRMNLGSLYQHTFKAWARILESDKQIKCMFFVPNYRTSPEYRFPAAIDDIKETYQWLIETMQVPAQKLLIGGDDAGAALAIDAMYTHALHVPGAIFASPYTGLEAGGESWRENMTNDWLNAAALHPEGGAQPFRYLGQNQKPLSSCVPPRMLIMVGGHEVLLDEAGYLAAAGREGGAAVTLFQAPSQVHLFSLLGFVFGDMNAWQQSVDYVASFVSDICNKRT